MAEAWWRRDASGLRLAVRIQPRAGADRVCGVKAGRLWIRIAAAPVEDAANERLCRFIADLFGVPRASVRVLQGNKSRDKLLAVGGVQQLPAGLAGLADETGQAAPAVRPTRAAAWISLLLLAACGDVPTAPPPARPYADPGFVAAGELRLHYALTPTLDLPSEIAGSYGIVQRRNLALLTITLVPRDAPGTTRIAASELAATAISLTGLREPLALARHDDAGGPTYLATVALRHRVPVTIEIRARATAESPDITARMTREFHLD